MNIRRSISSRWLGFKMKRGWAPRGRTDNWIQQAPSNESPQGALLEGKATFESLLTAVHKRRNPETGEYEEIGRRESRRVVTTVFVNDIVDALVAAANINDYKWHDSGTGVGGEVIGDTVLGTPCGEARDAGTQAEAAANIYETVAEHTYAGAFAITEHGVFDANAAGILMDRSVFAAINVAVTDKIEFTYRLTCAAGG